jgi:hypothetical protein
MARYFHVFGAVSRRTLGLKWTEPAGWPGNVAST